MATWFVDFVGGSLVASGSSYAQRVQDFSQISPAPGDHVRVAATNTEAYLGLAATFTYGSPILVSSSFSSKASIVTNGQYGISPGWQGGGGHVTFNGQDFISDPRTALGSFSFTWNTSGTSIYAPYSAAKNFSAFGAMCFWFKTDTPITGSIALCPNSDGTGFLTFYDFACYTANEWVPIVAYPHSGGGPLTAINSVSITMNGTATVKFSNIYMSDNMTLENLIGTSVAGEPWLSINCVYNGTINSNDEQNPVNYVRLDQSPGGSVTGTEWPGRTGALSTYILFTDTNFSLTSNSQALHQITWSGTAASSINVSGGWTLGSNMTTQSGYTWVDGGVGYGNGFEIDGSYINFSGFGAFRFNNGFVFTGTEISGTNLTAGNCTNCGFYGNLPTNLRLGSILQAAGNAYGLYYYGLGTPNYLYCDNIYADSNQNSGIYIQNVHQTYMLGASGDITTRLNMNYGVYINSAGGGRFGNVISNNNGSTDFYTSNNSELTIDSLTSTGASYAALTVLGQAPVTVNKMVTHNHTYGLNSSFGIQQNIYLNNATINETSGISFGANYLDNRVWTNNNNGTVNNNKVYTDGGYIDAITSTTPPGASLAYRVYIGSFNRNANYPIIVKIPAVIFNAGTLTLSMKTYFTSSNVFAQIITPAYTLPGITSDVLWTMNTTPGSWQNATVTLNPTGSGTADIYIYVWSGVSISDWFAFGAFGVSE
jgi:hypothetical protein